MAANDIPDKDAPELGAWIKAKRTEKGWSKAYLAVRLRISSPMVNYYETKKKTPSFEVYRKLEEVFSERQVNHVEESVAVPRIGTIKVGVPPVWDSALFCGFDDLLYMRGLDGAFTYLSGWGPEAIESLEEGRYNALIHNRFLISAAGKRYPHLGLKMSHPLYLYRGQFIFVRRAYVEQIAEQTADKDVKASLKAFAQQEYDLLGESLRFPRLASDLARRSLLANARFAYVPGTDLEEAIRQLYDDAMPTSSDSATGSTGTDEEEQSAWMARTASRSTRNWPSVKQMYKDFTATEPSYDVFCGGLQMFWEFAQHPDRPFLTICDPKELDTPSLNGIIVLDDQLKEEPERFDALASCFYAGANLFQEWYQSFPDGKSAASPGATHLRSAAHLAFLARVADEASPTGTEPHRSNDSYKSPYDSVEVAWGWSRLMWRFVTFFGSPSEANAAAEDPTADRYAASVSRLAERLEV